MPAPSALLRFAYWPVFALGFGGIGIHGIRSGWGVVPLGLLLFAAITVSFVAERALPYAEEWNQPRGDQLRDGIHVVVNETLATLSIAVLPAITGALGSVARGTWPHGLPFAVQLAGSLVVFDVGITLAHHASHRVAWLWRFHAVHHSVKRMIGVNGILKHPVHQTLEMIAGTLPLVVLGIPFEIASALAWLTAVQLLLQHSNVDYRLGPLRPLVAGAELHRLHHRKEPGRGDVNFGLFTSLVDRLLGTFDPDTRERLDSDALGIAGEPDHPTAYLAQLLEPFRPRSVH